MLASRPTVAIEVQPGVSAPDSELVDLRGWLVRRLLEEGYGVAAEPTGAHGVVRLRESRDGLVVEAEGRERRSFAIEHGPRAVLRLEVLHRALMGVEQTCVAADVVALPEPGLTLHFVDGVPDDALLEAIATAADGAGLTLTGQRRPGDTLACIATRGRELDVALGPADAECARPQLTLALAEDSVVERRRAARALVDAVRGSAAANAASDDAPLDVRALGGPAPGDPMPAPLVAAAEQDELIAMHGPPRAEMRLMASAGVAVRGIDLDPMVQVGWRAGRIRGIGGRISLSVVPGVSSSLGVVDSRLSVGPDWEWRAGRRGHFDVALMVGTELHSFTIGGNDGAADFAFAGDVPLSYSVSMRGGSSRVVFAVTPGLASAAWMHTSGVARDQAVLWRRTRWRVGLTIGVTHGWRIE